MPKIIYLIGPPCSGKSYYTQNTLLKLYPNAVIISNDAELETECEIQNKTYSELWGKFPFSVIKERCKNKFKEAITLGLDIIIDNTNMNRKARRTYIDPNYEVVFIDFKVSIETIKTRLEKRNKSGKCISFSVVEKMIESFQPPCKDKESCSELITIKG